MKHQVAISAYTPSHTDPALLRRIFVQRDRLLTLIVERLARSMLSGDKHHILLVGPRGSGKTHLVTLAVEDLRNRPELSDSMRIAWLGEDDTLTRLIDIALAAADSLANEYPDEFGGDYRAPVRGLEPDEAAESILHSLLERAGPRNLLLVTENFDQTMRGLRDNGQKRWRAFLQETARIATLATSQQLSDDISDRDKPFFGFFDIHHLKPLSVENARDLVAKISAERGNTELVEYLESPEGCYRIRALHYLAGGNHRMYVMLAAFLTKDSLDDLVEAFEQLAEDMTPYFQERQRSLPAQQAKLVQCLCNASGALTVREIAEQTFIDERSCSKQLGILRSKGYVRSENRGKESFCEMAEPLMRLCLEIKHQRGRPMALIARFLRAWFPEERLRQGLDGRVEPYSRVDEYRHAAIAQDTRFVQEIQTELLGEPQRSHSDGEHERAKRLERKLEYGKQPFSRERGDPARSWKHSSRAAGDLSEHFSPLADHSDPKSTGPERKIDRSDDIGRAERRERPREVILTTTDRDDVPIDQRAIDLFDRGVAHGQAGNIEAQLADYNALIDMRDAPVDLRAVGLYRRGLLMQSRGQFTKSLEDFSSACNLAGTSTPLLTQILFDIPKQLLHYATTRQVSSRLVAAFEAGDSELEGYGGNPRSMIAAVLSRGHGEWGEVITMLASVFHNYGVSPKLGHALVQSISTIDCGGYSDVQIDTWNQAWQDAGRDIDDLKLPLKALDTATAVIKTKSDRRLFQLPLEIRNLVRPLLATTLSK